MKDQMDQSTDGPHARLPFKELLAHTVTYGTGDLFIKAAAFITIPVYTRIFAPDDYGILNYVLSAIGLFTIVISLGAESTYMRFFTEAGTQKERQTVTSSWFGFLAVWSLTVAVACVPLTGALSRWSFGSNSQQQLLVCALLAVPVALINRLCGQSLRNQSRPGLFSLLNALSALLGIGLGLFGVLVLRLGLLGIFGGNLAAECIMLPIRLWTVRDLLRLPVSRTTLVQMLLYGMPLVPMALAYWVFGLSDRLLLGKLSELEQVGLYGVGCGLAGLLNLVNSAVGLAWVPIAMRMYENDRDRAPGFFGQVLTYLLTGFGLLAVGITVFAPEALALLTGPAYHSAARVVGPLALGVVAAASTQVTAIGISLTKKTKYFAVFALAAAGVNLGLNILFIPRWGMMAAAWTTVAAYTFLSLAYLVKARALWAVAYETRRTVTVLALTVAFVIAEFFLPEMGVLTGFVVKVAFCLGYVVCLIVLRVIDRREWSGLKALVRERESRR